MWGLLVTSSELTQLIKRSNQGDENAREEVVEVIYRELHRLARSRAYGEGETMRPTALVNEAFLKLFDRETQFEDRNQLLAHAALAMRQIVLNKAVKDKAQKRGGKEPKLSLEEWDGATSLDADYLALNEALAELERTRPRYAQILTLAFFAGFKNREIAEVLEVNERTIYRDLLLAKAWLKKRIGEINAGQNQS